MTGQELKQKLRDEGVNLAKLAEQLNITPQSLNSRFLVKSVKLEYLEEINSVLGKNIFPVGAENTSDLIPIYNVRICAGNGVGIGDVEPSEYISIPRLHDCVGGYVYGDSMTGMFNSGDLLIMREVFEKNLINYGRPYVLNIKEVGAVVKLVYLSRKENHVRLVAYNQESFTNGDRIYPDMEIHYNDIRNWYRVVERHETIA